jgi:hypothetical protein
LIKQSPRQRGEQIPHLGLDQGRVVERPGDLRPEEVAEPAL